MNRVFLHRATLPMAVKGVTLQDDEGDYTVIVNDQLCPEAQEETASHELAHIRGEHFSDARTVEDAERDAG